MRIRGIVAVGFGLLLGSALPASAQMMGGPGGQSGMMGAGMMEMMGGRMPDPAAMGGCPGMATQPASFGFERPWLSFALVH